MRFRFVVVAAIAAIFVLAAAGPAWAAEDMDESEKELRALEASWAKAFVAKDVDAIMDYYADNAVLMDPGPALEIRGKAAIRKSFVDFFAIADAITITSHNDRYRIVGNLAYHHSQFDMSIKDPKTGATSTMKGRALTVYEKRDGKWRAVADHASVPVPDEKCAGE